MNNTTNNIIDTSNNSVEDIDTNTTTENIAATATKEQLIQYIKEWNRIDNELNILRNEIDIRRKQREKISNILIQVMKVNEIDKFNLQEKNLVYMKKNQKKGLTQKHLFKTLGDFFKDEPEASEQLIHFIKENREYTLKETIIMKPSK